MSLFSCLLAPPPPPPSLPLFPQTTCCTAYVSSLWLRSAMIHLSVTVKSRWCPESDPKLWNSVCLRPLITNHLSFRCVWTRMTHDLRHTAGSTMCKCEENMVCEVWDWKGRRGGGGQRVRVYMCVFLCFVCVCVCLMGIRADAASGGPLLHLVIEETYSIMKQ